MMVVDQIFRLQNSYEKFKNSYRDEYVKVINYELVKSEIWSPSTLSGIKYNLLKCIEKIRRIFSSIFILLKETFVMSMRMVDALEMFYLSPDSRDDATNEFFVNGSELLDKLEENREVLLKGLNKAKPIIDEILNNIGSSYTADEFIEYSSDALETVADTHAKVQEVTGPLGKIVQEIGKRTLYGLAEILGLEKLIPKKLYPDYSVPPREIQKVFHFCQKSSIQIKY
jgi:hypothetical protein